MISKIALAFATLPIFILNNSMIANGFTASITPNILVQKKTPENLAAQALYYAENASTFNNHREYQRELNKAKRLILSLPNSEAKQNLIRALIIHFVIDDLFDCHYINFEQEEEEEECISVNQEKAKECALLKQEKEKEGTWFNQEKESISVNRKKENNCSFQQLLKIIDISPFAAKIVNLIKEGVPIDISVTTIQPRLIQDARNWRKSVLPKI